MGVKGLWEVLSPAREDVGLSQLEGLTLAVDVSGWICQFKSVPGLPYAQPLRSLFYRTTHLMNLGVKLVFVFDGKPPELKLKVIEERQAKRGSPSKGRTGSPGSPSKGRTGFNNSLLIQKARDLLESLGLPCLQAEGEAEALCAKLSQLQVVDGCLTEDGDALLYGARKVFTSLTLDKQTRYVESYSMTDVEEKLGLHRDDLITMALLTGCDYNTTGVRQVGMEKAVKLIKHLKTKEHNSLNRVCKWRECPELDELARDREMMKKEAHCKRCSHLGAVNVHMFKGCDVCVTKKGCKVPKGGTPPTQGNPPCPCDWHETDRRVRDHHLELNIREKALNDKDFPYMNIVEEFSGAFNTKMPEPVLSWKKPNLEVFVKHCTKILCWKGDVCVDKFLPVLVWSDLKAQTDKDYYKRVENVQEFSKPCQILKSCQKDYKTCYEISWKRLDCDIWSVKGKENYTSFVEQKMFAAVFREMTQEFEDAKEKEKAEKEAKKTASRGSKRKCDDDAITGRQQSRITEYFSQKKKHRPSVQRGKSLSSEELSSSSDESCYIVID